MKGNAIIFCSYLKQNGIEIPKSEFKFHEKRKWRFDYAWVKQKVALEVEGGVWTSGRHTRGSGFLGDMEKYNAASVLGWRIVRVTPSTLLKLDTIKMIKEILQINTAGL